MSPLPPGPHVFRICRAEFCRSAGSDLLIDHAEKRLGIKLGGTTGDGIFTLEAIYCLGNCGHSPSLLLDGTPYGSVSTQVIDSLVEDVRRRSRETTK